MLVIEQTHEDMCVLMSMCVHTRGCVGVGDDVYVCVCIGTVHVDKTC